MGGSLLLWDRERDRQPLRYPTLLPAPTLELDPAFSLWGRDRQPLSHPGLLPPPALELDPALWLQDRLGNFGMLRMLGLSQGSSSGSTAPLTPIPSGQPASPAADTAPAEDVAPPQLALANPYTDAYALATDYSLASHLLGLGFNAFPRHLLTPFGRKRWADRWLLNPLVRAGVATPLMLAEIAAMTYSHEMGHFRVGTELGLDPTITYPREAWWKIWKGETGPRPPDTDPLAQLRFDAAGVNQEHWNADYLFWDVARRGGGLSEAAAYFLSRSNTYLYSAVLPYFAGVSKLDDLKHYQDALASITGKLGITGHDLSRSAISWGSGLTTFLSSGTLGAFWSLGRYLFGSGESRFDIPTSRLGGFEFTWPDFNYLLTQEGPLFGGKALLLPRSRTPLGVSLDVRPGTSGFSFGAHLYDWRLGDKVRVSPFASFSADESLGAAFRFGADARVLLPYELQLIATPSLTVGTHLLDPERGVGGFKFNAAIGLPFR